MQQVVNGLVLGGIYLLFAVGLSLSWGTIGVLNLAHGATFTFSGFAAYLIAKDVGGPFWLLLLASMVIAGVLTVALDQLIFRQVQRRVSDPGEAELLMLIGSIGAGSALVTIVQRRTDDSPFGLPARSALTSSVHHVFGASITTIQILIIALGALLPLTLGLVIRYTGFGRALRAIAYDPETAQLMGVNRLLLSVMTMFIAGALAGLASMLLISHVGALTPESGDNLLLKGFAIIILGGIGSVLGVVVGAVVLAAGEVLVLTFTSGTWVDAASFALILVVILVRPRGLLPMPKAERV
ncbi:MAG: branched-chain amino acid transporter permease [Mycobacterium sp.]|jgi:branched-chain amino acid transport system permease protein|nr:branched-chain amino acid transporter permease [Mycobacterium sp.]MCW2744106.1 branched-chain amino acid transporter permease [Mycobacterium sp.]